MRRAYARAGKGPKRRNVWESVARWLSACGATAFLAWALLFPGLGGGLGLWLSETLSDACGGARFILPVLLANALWRARSAGRATGWTVLILMSGLTVASLAALLDLASPAGGELGSAVFGVVSAGLGSFGATLLFAAALLSSLQALFGIRWARLGAEAARVIADDVRQWQRSREELAARVKALPSSNGHRSGVKPVPPPIEAAKPEKAPPPPKELSDRPKSKPLSAGDTARAAPAPAGSPYADYKLPAIGLLNAPPAAADRGRPSEAEIASSIAALETTLRSFNIEARVTGYAPGPVITRFELAPAPGVKVSSIVALENDLALALKAKGIRIIAPIPGKAAVGIEIPNARPALVVLRDILESSAIAPDAPLLSFALGLSASGEPMAADLQRMPHLLIAGATNSGKSVMIHALILTMLFRARPDEVKFMMIDPKRLELTFYDGIPHLFDPMHSADKVSVITNAKDAAKSLQALVRLMEKRYEKFQLFGVRNIDSYNREADRRGQPREFFIVVVIDELADLMLVASDSVEDSIQRLTQMARAVGIHLVLCTQRPSVDVITGVIKANLPARVALQVISKVDSKVILDTTGADALQGKGDLLYLAAGAQKPERCQGAYVGEEEISKVAAHLKAQGKPDYPVLETMAAKGAADDLAALGVEPLEFSQALKLVLERRRVSQDLLKSQFGSSARATNLLSALEVKELIHKPEGSNRWEIHFDQIEDYLRTHFPQVPLDDQR